MAEGDGPGSCTYCDEEECGGTGWLVGFGSSFIFTSHPTLLVATVVGVAGVRCVPFLMNPSCYTTGWRVVYSLVGWLSLFLRGPFMSSLFVRTSLPFLFYVQDLSLALCLFVSNQTLCSAAIIYL